MGDAPLLEPTGEVPPPPETASPSADAAPAGFWPRLGAYFFDWIVVAFCSAIVATMLNLGAKTTTAAGETSYVYANAGWSQLIFLILSAVYAVGGWMIWTSTAVQRALGLQVVSSAGTPLKLDAAVVRWFLVFGVVAGLGALVILLPGVSNPIGLVQLIWIVVLIATTMRSPTGRGLHDRIAGSVVVER